MFSSFFGSIFAIQRTDTLLPIKIYVKNRIRLMVCCKARNVYLIFFLPLILLIKQVYVYIFSSFSLCLLHKVMCKTFAKWFFLFINTSQRSLYLCNELLLCLLTTRQWIDPWMHVPSFILPVCYAHVSIVSSRCHWNK